MSLPNNYPGPLLKDLRLTIVHPFYNDKERFQLQMENWETYGDLLKSSIDIIIADDGSKPSIASNIPRSQAKRLGLNLSIYRIEKDLKWNTPGALNLGISQARTDWVFFMDSDCLLREPDLAYIMNNLRPDPECSYSCKRTRVTDDPVKAKLVRPPTCATLLHRDAFDSVGGFDESFAGYRSGGYGFFDCDFVARMETYLGHKRHTLIGPVITEYLKDPGVQPKTGVLQDNLTINKRKYRNKHSKPLVNTNKLMFDWVKDLEIEKW